jgi:hypothetical protein
MKKRLPLIIATISLFWVVVLSVILLRSCNRPTDKVKQLEDSIRIYGEKAGQFAEKAAELSDSAAYYTQQYEKAKNDYNNVLFPSNRLDSLREVYRKRVYEDVARQLTKGSGDSTN